MSDTLPSHLQQFLDANPALEFAELMLVDPNGIIRGKWAPASTLKKAFAEGVNFPLSVHGLDVWGREVSATGLHIETGDRDGFFRAIPHTLALAPWGSGKGGQHLQGQSAPGKAARNTAQILLNTFTPEGEPFAACSRSALELVVNRLNAAGFFPVVAMELEFFLLKPDSDGGQPQPVGHFPGVDIQDMYSLDVLSDHGALFRDIRAAASLSGLPIDTIIKEAAPGQFEINLTHRADALRAADDAILLRKAVTDCARAHGLKATFMAKPFLDQPGNGLHVHASLLDAKGSNVFSGEGGQARLESAAAGLLSTMAEANLLFINTVNGFRRMAPGSYAPTRANWGENNRSVAVRVPASGEEARRLEHRISGADANPYLVMAAVLQAMLEGIETKMPALPQLVGNAYDPAAQNRGEKLPDTMPQALAAFEKSRFMHRAIGERLCHIVACVKRAEMEEFERYISPLERLSYL